MTLKEMAEFICGKVNQTEPEDIAACQGFLRRRHEMLWQDQLWKDSLAEYTQTLEQTGYTVGSNWLPTKGVLLLPPGFDRILAVRTDSRSLRVQRPELLYRIDYDTFNKRGDLQDFVQLSACVWETERSNEFWLLFGDPDKGVAVVADRLSSDGVTVSRVTRTLNDSRAILTTTDRLDTLTKPVTSGSFALIAFDPEADAVVSGAGSAVVNGTYVRSGSLNGRPRYVKTGTTLEIAWYPGGAFGMLPQWTIADNPPAPSVATQYYHSLDNVSTPHAVTTWATGGISSGSVPVPSAMPAVGVLGLSAAVTNAPKRQRIRFVEKPDSSVTVRVLGKRSAPVFSADNDEPSISGATNTLLAFAQGDMLQRERQYGKAQALYQEAMALFDQVKRLETVQQAHQTRIIPEGGYGEPFFGGMF
jgi:hypothetical protein